MLALTLIIIGLGLIIAEIFANTFGALGIVGLIAFIVGSILLSDGYTQEFPLLLPILIGIAFAAIIYLIILIQLAIRARRKPIVSGREELIGSTGNVIIIPGDEERPRVRIRGELWQIRSNVPLKEGETVKVIAIDELILQVIPVPNTQINNGA